MFQSLEPLGEIWNEMSEKKYFEAKWRENVSIYFRFEAKYKFRSKMKQK